MKKNPEDIAYQVLHEVMFAGTDKKSSDAISKLLKQGKIRRIAPKIYTTNFEANGEDIVRRNIFSILGRLYPGAILSHRTAFECMPTSSGDIFLTYKYSRKISLPGVTVHLLEGPQVDANDRPFIDGLYMSHQTRAFLENMQASKNIGGADKCLGQQQIEEKLEKIVRVNGETALNVLRDEARETAERLGFQKEFAKLSQLISAILTTHTSSILRSPLTIARAMGEPYDAERMDLFQNAFAYLTNYEFAYRENVQWEDHAFRNFAFFESYFSNYIEGTEFTIEDARTIISTGRPMPSRRDDSHDILGTYFVAANKIEMQRIPQAAEELLQMLQARHKILLEARQTKNPGLFKMRNNHAGETYFVDYEYVRGTLLKAFGLYNALTHPMARAIMMHVIIAEVHPFDDGNGRMARIMMNAELVSQRQSKVIIPNVFRDDYILALKKFSHQRDISTLVQVLDKMQQYAGRIPCGSFEEAHEYLTLTNAYKEPDEARLIM